MQLWMRLCLFMKEQPDLEETSAKHKVKAAWKPSEQRKKTNKQKQDEQREKGR